MEKIWSVPVLDLDAVSFLEAQNEAFVETVVRRSRRESVFELAELSDALLEANY